MSLWVKPKVLAVAHNTPHNLSLLSFCSDFPPFSLAHSSGALLTPLKSLTHVRHCFTSGPCIAPNTLPSDVSLPSLTATPVSPHTRGLSWPLCLKLHHLLLTLTPCSLCFFHTCYFPFLTHSTPLLYNLSSYLQCKVHEGGDFIGFVHCCLSNFQNQAVLHRCPINICVINQRLETGIMERYHGVWELL